MSKRTFRTNQGGASGSSLISGLTAGEVWTPDRSTPVTSKVRTGPGLEVKSGGPKKSKPLNKNFRNLPRDRNLYCIFMGSTHLKCPNCDRITELWAVYKDYWHICPNPSCNYASKT